MHIKYLYLGFMLNQFIIFLTLYKTIRIIQKANIISQSFGSVSFWCGSASGMMGPDPTENRTNSNFFSYYFFLYKV